MSTLEPAAVLAYGRSWVHRLLGSGHACAVFLAGGAFKTLLHGRPPRDLDLWAPDEQARRSLVELLLRRGAIRIRDNPPFQEVFSFAGQCIEVAYDTRHPTLESLLSGCDLALSAVGYAQSHGVERCVIHPHALESVLQRRVLLLDPLVNWKYALYTLERLHRYGTELGYEVRNEEEELIWATFTAQSPDVRRGMIERYKRVSAPLAAILRRAES